MARIATDEAPLAFRADQRKEMRYELVFYETRRFTKIVEVEDIGQMHQVARDIENTDGMTEDNEYYELSLESWNVVSDEKDLHGKKE